MLKIFTALLSAALAYGTVQSSFADTVDFQTFELDGNVKNMLWCGPQDEIILVQTTDGSVYRSRDRGSSWKRLKSVMEKQASQIVDDNQDVRIRTLN